MCRVVVFIAQNDHPDARKDYLQFKRGDVVDVHADGFFLGHAVENNEPGIFHIFELPGVPVSEIKFLTNPPLVLREGDQARRRAYTLDVGVLAGMGSRTQVTKNQVLVNYTTKPLWRNLLVIG